MYSENSSSAKSRPEKVIGEKLQMCGVILKIKILLYFGALFVYFSISAISGTRKIKILGEMSIVEKTSSI